MNENELHGTTDVSMTSACVRKDIKMIIGLLRVRNYNAKYKRMCSCIVL